MSDMPIKKEVVVKYKDDTFTFKMPTVHDDIKIGVRSRRILMTAADPGDRIEEESAYDFNTRYFVQACAIFETQLVSTTAKWVHTPRLDGGPTIDSSKFGPERADEIVMIITDYKKQVDTFRTRGDSDKSPVDGQVVASQ